MQYMSITHHNKIHILRMPQHAQFLVSIRKILNEEQISIIIKIISKCNLTNKLWLNKT